MLVQATYQATPASRNPSELLSAAPILSRIIRPVGVGSGSVWARMQNTMEE